MKFRIKAAYMGFSANHAFQMQMKIRAFVFHNIYSPGAGYKDYYVLKTFRISESMSQYLSWTRIVSELQRARTAVVEAGAPAFKCSPYSLLRASPGNLDKRLLRAQSRARISLGYPTEHPSSEELQRYDNMETERELGRMREQDRRFQDEMDRALRD